MVQTSIDEWQSEYRAARLTLAQLLERLDLSLESLPYDVDHESSFEVSVPPHFLSLIKKADPLDPLLLQVIARAQERIVSEHASDDPVAEMASFRSRGIVQKYKGRILLVASGACAIHCRYCFRRHYDYAPIVLTQRDLDVLKMDLASDPSINEVILSGGDPLSLSDDRLSAILDLLDSIETLRSIRIHSRTVTTVPSRMTERLLSTIGRLTTKIAIVIHTNHPTEIDPVVGSALKALRDAGSHVFNQAVLLAGVNDSVKTLHDHSWRLWEVGALPYYLNLLDPVAGAEHFNVSLRKTIEIQRMLRAVLPGYLVPRFVREVPGELNKTPLDEIAAKPEYYIQS